MHIKGKTIAIASAGRGLGQVWRALASEGARLVLVDLSQEQLVKTACQCGLLGATVGSFAADVSKETDVQALFEGIARDVGRIDALINNAGLNADRLLVKRRNGTIEKMSIEGCRS